MVSRGPFSAQSSLQAGDDLGGSHGVLPSIGPVYRFPTSPVYRSRIFLISGILAELSRRVDAPPYKLSRFSGKAANLACEGDGRDITDGRRQASPTRPIPHRVLSEYKERDGVDRGGTSSGSAERLRWSHAAAIFERLGNSGILAAVAGRRIGTEGSRQRAVDRSAVERGRVALTLTGFLKPEWSESAYRNAGQLWDQPAPDPDTGPGRLCVGIPVSVWLASGPLPQRRPAHGPAARARARRDQDGPANRLHGLSRRLDRRPELRRAGQHPARSQGLAQRADDGRRPASAAADLHPELVPRDQ